jgi:hypothetical protein
MIPSHTGGIASAVGVTQSHPVVACFTASAQRWTSAGASVTALVASAAVSVRTHCPTMSMVAADDVPQQLAFARSGSPAIASQYCCASGLGGPASTG